MLQATYEATLFVAAARAAAGRSRIVRLTRVGGGALGNGDDWITEGVVRTLRVVEDADLDVRLVSYGSANPEAVRIARHGQD